MSTTLDYKLEVFLSSDSDGKDRDRGAHKLTAQVKGLAVGGSWERQVPNSTVDLELDLPGISAGKFLLLFTRAVNASDTPVKIDVKRNSAGGEAIPVDPIDGTQGHLLLSTSALTSLFVTNSDASVDMEVTWVVVGDA